jgi:hypothetical protein
MGEIKHAVNTESGMEEERFTSAPRCRRRRTTSAWFSAAARTNAGDCSLDKCIAQKIDREKEKKMGRRRTPQR